MGALITDLMSLSKDLSFSVRIAWGVWIGWGVVHLAWTFWPRRATPLYRTASGVRPSARYAVSPRAVTTSTVYPEPAAVAVATSAADSDLTLQSAPGKTPMVRSRLAGSAEFLAALGLDQEDASPAVGDPQRSVYR